MLFWIIWLISFVLFLIQALESDSDIGFVGIAILATIDAYTLEYIIEFALSIAQ